MDRRTHTPQPHTEILTPTNPPFAPGRRTRHTRATSTGKDSTSGVCGAAEGEPAPSPQDQSPAAPRAQACGSWKRKRRRKGPRAHTSCDHGCTWGAANKAAPGPLLEEGLLCPLHRPNPADLLLSAPLTAGQAHAPSPRPSVQPRVPASSGGRTSRPASATDSSWETLLTPGHQPGHRKQGWAHSQGTSRPVPFTCKCRWQCLSQRTTGPLRVLGGRRTDRRPVRMARALKNRTRQRHAGLRRTPGTRPGHGRSWGGKACSLARQGQGCGQEGRSERADEPRAVGAGHAGGPPSREGTSTSSGPRLGPKYPVRTGELVLGSTQQLPWLHGVSFLLPPYPTLTPPHLRFSPWRSNCRPLRSAWN